jgi:hypothetical protein
MMPWHRRLDTPGHVGWLLSGDIGIAPRLGGERMTRTMNLARLCIALAMVAAAPGPARSDETTSARLDALFGAHEPYEAFLARLQDAVAAGDREAVAAMVAYPLETRVAGLPVTLAAPEDVVRRYDQLFTPPVVAALERQSFATLFANAEGVMVGDGEVWFSGVCGDEACADVAVRIIAVNPPIAPVGPEGTDPGTDR